MANFIINELELVGDADTIAKVTPLLLIDGELTFEALMTIPSNVSTNTNVWCCENWGTKWDAREVGELNVPEGAIGWHFSTGWTAPELWFQELASKINSMDVGRVAIMLSWADGSDNTGYHMTRNAAGRVERTAMTADEVTNFLGAENYE